jgi:heme-degrading monooxygenase HmoA
MYARVAIYKLKPNSADHVIKLAENGLLPIYRKHEGFHSYEVIKAGHDTIISISGWDTEQQGAAAVRSAAAWVKDSVAEHVVSVENHVGAVAFSHRASRTAAQVG